MRFVGLEFRISWVVLAMVVLWSLSFPTDSEAGYRGPFKGRVVDAETSQPIQGAVVFVEWQKEILTPLQPTRKFYDAAEVLTDENGEFYIPKKWSWNPWTNLLMLDGEALIFKSGYGNPENLHWQYLRGLSASQKARSPEERKKLGTHFYFDIAFENGLPVFLLQKLTTKEERLKSIGFTYIGSEVPHAKKRWLIKEINRERRSLGYGEVTD